jgi:ubiquinone/menaquinone biosynthesis C-methylase UbiE
MSAIKKRSEEVDARRAYETEGVYSVQTICRKMRGGAREYADELLSDKLETVRRHLGSGLLVDLCCGTGDHLLTLCPPAIPGLGVDFSIPYVDAARKNAKETGLPNIAFAVADAMALPLQPASVGTLYSLSALYQVPEIEKVITEVARVLAPHGRAILDLGNSESLNAICCRSYPELPRMTAISIDRMIELFKANKLSLLEHRAFQILPLWAGRPKWLWPLLHPGWKRIMKVRVLGKMIDEWVSSSPVLKSFAFRHLVVLEKCR